MCRLLTYYTVEELNLLNNNEKYDFLEQMDLKRPYHLDKLVFKIDGIYKRAFLIKENKMSAIFLIDGIKINAKYNDKLGYHINKNSLKEMSDEDILKYNYVNSLKDIELMETLMEKLRQLRNN